ncbi:MAG: hypothetical protein A2Y03_00865 [Omnitrophica WOR_2 bacterium GWF2_38_59]|nr:MAG: hypothetical protein A2Y03_00865 [Omnitrophica WOR_2 bacterium GWF2_38_59]OGX46907.1 MAG: hypothetical protein A2243_11985 [Omnitrophica WOR_2 bacterium RIFOXYA2_FULL_38_17]HBG60609.1 hypothetical protein [Candidatus Omnitrophota bacterium]
MFSKAIKKVIVSLMVFAFLGAQVFPLCPVDANAQSALVLPSAGAMIQTSPPFSPAVIQGITLYPENPLKFDFIIDKGDTYFESEEFQDEANRLINYFMASLTVPEDEMWVNLSPYEKDRIIADGLIQTELGRDMLAQDYLLKQITASFMHPDGSVGAEFWKKIYEKAQALYGTTEMPVNTFNKVWIVPEEAVVYVHGTSAFVVESHLKVMLEGDYMALDNNSFNKKIGTDQIEKRDVEKISDVSSAIVRDVILPELEKEVNEGENFATLRQMFNSMILATWYKQNLKNSLFGEAYINRNKVSGIDLAERGVKEKIYDQYVEAFKKGVYDFVREEYDDATQEIIPRKYFSGGIVGQKSVKDTSMLGDNDKIGSLLDGENKEKVTVEIKVGDRDVSDATRASDAVVSDNREEYPLRVEGDTGDYTYSLSFVNPKRRRPTMVPNAIEVNRKLTRKELDEYNELSSEEKAKRRVDSGIEKVDIDLRRIIHEKFEGFLTRTDYVQNVLGDIDSDVYFQDIKHIDIEFIRLSERVVFNVKIYTKDGGSEPSEEFIAKVVRKRNQLEAGENEFEFEQIADQQVEAFEKLKSRGVRFVPRYAKTVDGVYYEEVIRGKSILQYAASEGLTTEEIEEIAYTWLTIWRHVKDSSDPTSSDPKMLDLNPGNIMIREGEDLLDSHVVIDIFSTSKGSYNPKSLVRDLLRFYVYGGNPAVTVKSKKSNDIEPVLEGIYRGLDYDRAQTIKFLTSITHSPVVPFRQWSGKGQDPRISDLEFYAVIEQFLKREFGYQETTTALERYNNIENFKGNQRKERAIANMRARAENATGENSRNSSDSIAARGTESPTANPGGIDLDADNMNLKVEGNMFNFQLPDDFEGIDINAEGFLPVIINISPIIDMPLLLGVAEDEEYQPQLSYSLN